MTQPLYRNSLAANRPCDMFYGSDSPFQARSACGHATERSLSFSNYFGAITAVGNAQHKARAFAVPTGVRYTSLLRFFL